MKLDQWLVKHVGYEYFLPGEDRFQRALSLLGLDFSKCKIITIAGTNGKGETSRYLYELCLSYSNQSPQNIALWTSPHILSVRERFVKGGEKISEQDLLTLFIGMYQRLQQEKLKLSYYEFLFACFLEFTADCKLLILEVGLGGRLDAVNYLNTDLALITSISRDHQAILGNRLEQILQEKIAVARPQAGLITNLELHYLRNKAKRYADVHSIDMVDVNDSEELGDKTFSQQNRRLAQLAFERFFKTSLPIDGLAEAPVLRKFEFGEATCHALGSHNPDGMRKGVQFLLRPAYTGAYKLLLMSFSQRDDKDAQMMLKLAKILQHHNKVSSLALCYFEHEKAMPLAKLQELAKRSGWECYNDAREVFETYELAGEKVLVLGSYYFLGHLLNTA